MFRASRDSEGGGSESSLWIRSLKSLTSLPLGGTEGVSTHGPIVWPPDGGSLLFRVGEHVQVLDVANGTTRALSRVDPNHVSDASWNDSGTIMFSAGRCQSLIYSVPASGGEATQLTTLNDMRGEVNHHFAQFLPDGNRFLFMVFSEQPENTGLYLASLDEPADFGQIALSPDGRNLALEIRDDEGQYDLWVMDVVRGVTSRVTATEDGWRRTSLELNTEIPSPRFASLVSQEEVSCPTDRDPHSRCADTGLRSLRMS